MPALGRVPSTPAEGGGVCVAALTEQARAAMGVGRGPGAGGFWRAGKVKPRGDFPSRGGEWARNGARPLWAGAPGELRKVGRAACSGLVVFPVCCPRARIPLGQWGAATWGTAGASRAGCPPAGVAGRGWATGEVELGTSLLTVQGRTGKLLQ